MPERARTRASSDRGLSEKPWQGQVVSLARIAGFEHFHNHYALGSDSGFPDLTLVHEISGGLLFAELKRDKAKCSHRQRWWLNLLSQKHAVYVWRPQDVEHVPLILRSVSLRGPESIASSAASRWIYGEGTWHGDVPLTPEEIAAGLHLQRRRRRG